LEGRIALVVAAALARDEADCEQDRHKDARHRLIDGARSRVVRSQPVPVDVPFRAAIRSSRSPEGRSMSIVSFCLIRAIKSVDIQVGGLSKTWSSGNRRTMSSGVKAST
jgi:hypothetical protein